MDASMEMPTNWLPSLHSVSAVHLELEPDVSEDEQWLEEWTQDEVRQWQRDDPTLEQVIQWLDHSLERPDEEGYECRD